MRAQALAALWLCACSGGPGLIVDTGQVPPGAALIQPYLSVDGKPSQDIAPFAAIPGQATQTFGLRLPSGVGMQAHLGAQVLDQNGCFLATGVADAEVRDGQRITLPLATLPAVRCDKKRPLLLSMAPALAPTTGGTTVSLRGAGLQPSDAVTFGAAPAPSALWRSPMEISVPAPPHKGIGEVPVAVRDPGGGMDQFATQFRYYTTAPDFVPASHSLSAGGVPITVVGMAVGLLDANLYPDLVGLVSAPQTGVLVVLDSRLTLASPMLPILYPLSGTPVAVTTGVLTDTTNVDLVVSVQGNTHVYAFYNQGDGTFGKNGDFMTPDTQSLTLGGQPGALAVADVNGDGKDDVLGANQNKSLSVLLRVASRTWATVQAYPLDLAPRDLAVGDLTGDGRPDVVVVYQGLDNGVDVLVNQGDGTFPKTGYRQSRATGSGLHQPVLADLDGDGHLDLAFTSEAPGQVSVWLNVDGQFMSPVRADYAVGMRPVALAAGDLDGDGLQDLVALPADGTGVAILLNQLAQPGKLQLYGRTYPVQQGSQGVIVLDADQDGANDIGVLGTTNLVGIINSSP